MLICFKDYSERTVHFICPAQPIESPGHQQSWHWSHKSRFSVSSITGVKIDLVYPFWYSRLTDDGNSLWIFELSGFFRVCRCLVISIKNIYVYCLLRSNFWEKDTVKYGRRCYPKSPIKGRKSIFKSYDLAHHPIQIDIYDSIILYDQL